MDHISPPSSLTVNRINLCPLAREPQRNRETWAAPAGICSLFIRALRGFCLETRSGNQEQSCSIWPRAPLGTHRSGAGDPSSCMLCAGSNCALCHPRWCPICFWDLASSNNGPSIVLGIIAGENISYSPEGCPGWTVFSLQTWWTLKDSKEAIWLLKHISWLK